MKSCVTISLVEEARGGPFVLWDGLEAGCKLAAELGFDAVEIFTPAVDAINPRELAELLDQNDILLAAVGTGAGWVKHKLSLTDADPDKRAAAKEFVRGIIDFAGGYGASAIIGSMQGRAVDGVTKEQAIEYLGTAVAELGEYANKHSVPLFYEPLNRYETNLVNTVGDGVRLLESYTATNVKLLCDLFHMNIEEVSIEDSLLAGGSYVGHIHFVDSTRKAVGFGHMDFGPIMRALNAINYNGYLCAEAFPLPDSLTAAQQTIDAFTYWTGCR